MSSLVCPHCGASNAAGAAFCESCGKALPLASSTGPRIVTAESLPATAAGQQALGDQLVKTTKRAANTLLVVGILQIIAGAIYGAILANAPNANRDAIPLIVGIPVVVGVIFIGLSFWARRSPLPATIVGLVLYGTLLAINVVTWIGAMSQAGAEGARGLPFGLLDIVIVVFLARGIKAALDHRKLERAGGMAA